MSAYYLFAAEFGYTPDQVDELDLVTANALAIINESKHKEEDRLMKNAQRR